MVIYKFIYNLSLLVISMTQIVYREQDRSKRIEFIKNVIKDNNDTILDVGCFQGVLHSALLQERDILGIDIKLKKYPLFVNASANALPFRKSSLKIIVAGELIEHLKNPDTFLRECFITLESQGILILTTPNKDSWWNRLTGSYYFPSDHFSVMNEEEIVNILIDEGFSIEHIEYIPFDQYTSGSGLYHLYFIRKLIHRIIPNRLRENMIIVSKSGVLQPITL